MSKDSAFSYGTSVVPGLTMLAGTSRLSYASLKFSSEKSFATSSPARRTSLAFLLVTRKPLSQGGRGGGAVSFAARSLGMPMPCVVMVFERVSSRFGTAYKCRGFLAKCCDEPPRRDLRRVIGDFHESLDHSRLDALSLT